MCIQLDNILRKMAALAELNPVLRLLVLHDDAEREFDYVAGAEKTLQIANEQNWTVVSIQHDWQQVFPVQAV